MNTFQIFSKLVHDRYNAIKAHELFKVDTDLFPVYLDAFPEGTNPIYKTRTEHDCACCKQFIRNLGSVVAIIDGKIATVWDVDAPHPYDKVAQTLQAHLKSSPILQVFRTSERQFGAEHTLQKLETGVKRWNHFHGQTAQRHLSPTPAAQIGVYNAAKQVFQRGMTEITPSSIATVIDLIADNNLYRGSEFLAQVKAYRDLQNAYNANPTDLFLWDNALHPQARLRNTAIGTLLIDLSEGKDVEQAVRSFESIMAPANYKRPKALITQAMVEQALKTVDDLNLADALPRRMATLQDITVNNVLWANRQTQSVMKSAVENVLLAAVTKKAPTKALDLSISEFQNMLPSVTDMHLFVQSPHEANIVTLTAPVNPTPHRLFKWDNNFAWSYKGNVADSIKERVKLAGGKVEGDLCCRLAWEYADDLDFHMEESNGGHIYYGNRCRLSSNGGMLDVDANGIDGQVPHPVENIVYSSATQMQPGAYRLYVNNYSRRSNGSDFEVEIDLFGQVFNLQYKGVLREKAYIDIGIFTKTATSLTFEPNPNLSTTISRPSKDLQGVLTESFVKVNTLMLSPNYWDDNKTGNKHWFFMLDGLKTTDKVRGMYNEFLRPDLEAHRRVFEVLGDRMQCPLVDDQLTGLGFSSTRGDKVIVQVTTANGVRAYNVTF